jgi:hypothetical protein
LNVLSDGAAGHFYNFENEDFLYEASTYRHLLIKNTDGPLRLYNMCSAAAAAPAAAALIANLCRNFEHASSEANAEFQNSSNIFVYSLKSEGEWRDLIYHGGLNNPGVALWVRNCSEVHCCPSTIRFKFFSLSALCAGQCLQFRGQCPRHGDRQILPSRFERFYIQPFGLISVYLGFSQFAPSLYRFENTCPLRVTNCVDQVDSF